MADHDADPALAAAPLLRVVRGSPDAAEVAALVAVLAARAARGRGDAEPVPGAGWSAHWRRVGAAPLPGPGTWRGSARG